jgi:lauroyl/myristoyl acyltransferase
MEFPDNSRVRLFRVLIREYGEDNFRVVRWGGRSKILTRQFGVDAIQLLRKGFSLGEVKVALAKKHGCEPSRVDLSPLLEALRTAELIRTINGNPVSTNRQLTPLNIARFVWRFYLSIYLHNLSAACLPLGASRQARFWIDFFGRQRAMKPRLGDAARNMAAVWPSKTAGEIRRIQNEFYFHWIWNDVDFHTLETNTAARVDRWITDNISCKGIEHLDAARKSNKGVILCIFHFTSTRLIPLVLMKHGYPVAAIGPANMGWGMRKTLTLLEKWHTELPDYAHLRLFDDFRLENLRKLVLALKSGEIGVCMADVVPGVPADQSSKMYERKQYFRYAPQTFPRATVSVTLLGQRVDMTPWVGWLGSISGAIVLPTLMLRKPDTTLELRIGPPVSQSQIGTVRKTYIKETLNDGLYRTLEQYVAQYPAQWFAWFNLHKVGLQSVDEPTQVKLVTGRHQVVTAP